MGRTIPGVRPGSLGVFDSGVGGLTVARALRRALPGERILYFGDTAHVPYGNKSEETVTQLSLDASRFLVRHGVKLVVVACNTATAVALPVLQKKLPVPVVGVIEPGARAAAESGSRRIGVIGTFRTVRSGAYEKAIRGRVSGVKVHALACPLLVPLIEEGFRDTRVVDSVLRAYLEKLAPKIDTLVLGCTHYPLIRDRIHRLYPRLRLIDSADETAKEVKDTLARLDLAAAPSTRDAATVISTNDLNETFQRVADRLFKKKDARLVTVRPTPD